MAAIAPTAVLDVDWEEERQPQSDETLYARVGAGDEAALRALLDRHVRAMRKLAMNILRDAHESEDVVQEVFAGLWRNSTAWDSGGAKFSTWLSRVTINRAIDHRRKLRAVPREPVEITVLSDARAPVVDASEDDALDARRLAAVVEYMLTELPEAQRRAMRHCYFEDMSVSEIAVAMGLSEQAVRALLKRAKAGVRVLLARRQARRDSRRV